MSEKRLSHAAIVKLLGGMNAVAPALGIAKPNTVAHWKRPDRGIPPLYWAPIVRLARARGIDLSIADLEQTSPQPRVRSRGAPSTRCAA